MIVTLGVGNRQTVLRAVHAHRCAFDRIAVIVENLPTDVSVGRRWCDRLVNHELRERSDVVNADRLIRKVSGLGVLNQDYTFAVIDLNRREVGWIRDRRQIEAHGDRRAVEV